MDVDPAVLRTRLGLAEDADEAAITAALSAEPQHPNPEPVAPAVPEGMVLVDSETWSSVRQGAEQGAAVAARLARQERDRVIQAAIEDGKFAPSRREHYQRLFETDEQGARELIASMASGLVPVGRREVGAGGDGESQTDAGADHAAFMAAHFPNETARLANRNSGRVRVRQEA